MIKGVYSFDDFTVDVEGKAMHYLMLGDKERSIQTLEAGLASNFKSLPRINAEPVLDSLRSEPRFVDLIRKMGLRP
jgi:hypothetical protein